MNCNLKIPINCLFLLFSSGSIDFDEFCLMMVKQLEAEQEEKVPARPEKELAEAFKIFDTKLDSKIDWDELKAALEATGEAFEVFFMLIDL